MNTLNQLMNVKLLMNAATREYYKLYDGQFTLPTHDDGSYDGLLSTVGYAILEDARLKVLHDTNVITIKNYYVLQDRSGSWHPDPNSRYYDVRDLHVINSTENRIIVGVFQKNGIDV